MQHELSTGSGSNADVCLSGKRQCAVAWGVGDLHQTHGRVALATALSWAARWRRCFLLAATFGAGMSNVVDTTALGGLDGHSSYITPGILAFTALSAAVNAGMTALEEKIRGFLKEYLVVAIPLLQHLAGIHFEQLGQGVGPVCADSPDRTPLRRGSWRPICWVSLAHLAC